MAQVKIYGLREHLEPSRAALSGAIHACVVAALDLPVDKRFQRFFPVDASNWFVPEDRSPQYTIIEIIMFEGRTLERKKQLIRLLFERIEQECGIRPQDVEITILESPRANWGIRGLPADELGLSYRIEE